MVSILVLVPSAFFICPFPVLPKQFVLLSRLCSIMKSSGDVQIILCLRHDITCDLVWASKQCFAYHGLVPCIVQNLQCRYVSLHVSLSFFLTEKSTIAPFSSRDRSFVVLNCTMHIVCTGHFYCRQLVSDQDGEVGKETYHSRQLQTYGFLSRQKSPMKNFRGGETPLNFAFQLIADSSIHEPIQNAISHLSSNSFCSSCDLIKYIAFQKYHIFPTA